MRRIVCPVCWEEHWREDLNVRESGRPIITSEGDYTLTGTCPVTGKLLLLSERVLEDADA